MSEVRVPLSRTSFPLVTVKDMGTPVNIIILILLAMRNHIGELIT